MSHSIIRQPSLDQIIDAAVQKGSIESLCQGHKGATLLLRAVRANNTKMVRILLQQGAVNPNYGRKERPGKEKYYQWRDNPRHTDRAIDHGNVEMLELLLQNPKGACCLVGDCNVHFGTSLNNLLLYGYKSREIKLAICRLLVENARKDEAATTENDDDESDSNNTSTSIFLQTTLWWSIVLNGQPGVEILLEAGVEPRGTALLYRAIRKNNVGICQVLLQYGANPFLQEPEQEHLENFKIDKNVHRAATTTTYTLSTSAAHSPCSSPFHAAARLSDTSFLELFLKHWDSTRSKKGDDESYYPIQILYGDSQQYNISLEAVKLIVAHACKADALMKKDAITGLYPWHSAAMMNASLDVIFLLLKHWPSALGHQPPPSRMHELD